MGQASKQRSFEYRRDFMVTMLEKDARKEIEDYRFEQLIRKGIIVRQDSQKDKCQKAS